LIEYPGRLEELFEAPHDSFPEDTPAARQVRGSQAEREKEREWEVERGGPAGFGTTSHLQALGG